MRDFDYQSANSIDDALTLRSAGETLLLAGGTDLIAQMKEGRRHAPTIVDVKRLPGLGTIDELPDGGLRVGAAASATSVARHAIVRKNYPAVSEAAGMIGSWQIQNRATLGGNICNAAPSADAVPALICNDASATVSSPDGERSHLVEDLFTGPGRTILAPTDILTFITMPAISPRTASTYLRFTPRREMDIAVVGVGARLDLDADGRITTARIALASVAPTPIRASSAEAALVGQAPSTSLFTAAGEAARGDASPISDTRGSADYRRHLVGVLCKRALTTCAERLGVEVPA